MVITTVCVPNRLALQCESNVLLSQSESDYRVSGEVFDSAASICRSAETDNLMFLMIICSSRRADIASDEFNGLQRCTPVTPLRRSPVLGQAMPRKKLACSTRALSGATNFPCHDAVGGAIRRGYNASFRNGTKRFGIWRRSNDVDDLNSARAQERGNTRGEGDLEYRQ